LTSVAFLVAALCAGVMGFAIQRGATCTVAAVDELVYKRRFRRLAAMVEASLWVVGGLAIAQAARLLPMMPQGLPVTAATIVGGVLLGLGAHVNRACVFGAIARLGSGEWSYAATPIGFYVGCLTFTSVVPEPMAGVLPYGSPVLAVAPWIALPFAAFVLWRIGRRLFARGAVQTTGSLVRRVRNAVVIDLWSPHAATTVIGVTFLVMMLTVGAWAYTDVLAELAHGMVANVAARILLLVALFGGALAGGWTAGRFRSTALSAGQLARCFGGGVLMGWGSLWIPGGNDGLILVGMPLLWPYAWVAFLTMCVSIGAAMLAQGALAVRRGRRFVS
jgi:toxin CptA